MPITSRSRVGNEWKRQKVGVASNLKLWELTPELPGSSKASSPGWLWFGMVLFGSCFGRSVGRFMFGLLCSVFGVLSARVG